MLSERAQKTILLCLTATLCTTIGSLSQTPEAPSATAKTPMALPADNVNLVNISGRSITGKVLARDDKGISIRMGDGTEHHIAWDKLNQATIDMLNGVTVKRDEPKAPLEAEKKESVEKSFIPFVFKNPPSSLYVIGYKITYKKGTQETINVSWIDEDGVILEQPQSKEAKIRVITWDEMSDECMHHFKEMAKEWIGYRIQYKNGTEETINVRSWNNTGISVNADKIERKSKTIRWAEVSQKDFDYFIGITKEDLVKQLRKILESPKPAHTDKDQRLAYDTNRSLVYSAISRINYQIEPKLKNLSALELHKLFLSDADDVFINTYLERQRYKDTERNDPKWKICNPSPFETLASIQVKPDDFEEHVSIRAQFEKLGVVTVPQTFELELDREIENSFRVKSFHELCQYACLADGGKPPSLEELKASYLKTNPSGPYFDGSLITALQRSYGKQPTVLNLDTGIQKLTDELIKDQLRKGHACRLRVQGLPGIIVIGFHAKNGKTTFEYLNGASILPGKNYIRSGRTGDQPYSLWFE